MKTRFRYLLVTALLLLFLPPLATATEMRIATAANFLGTLQELTARYEEQTGHRFAISSGSSGALYAQITNGAPFDLFFSADRLRAETLVSDGLAHEDSRFTYAVGVPVLWSSREGWLEDPETILTEGSYRFLSTADPRNAPYGVAAQQILESLGVWGRLNQEGRLVRAQNITQAYAQAASGAAELGFVALSQVKDASGNIPGSHWIPPAELFDPIEQQAVILKRVGDLEVARDFMAWMRGEDAARIIKAAGYAVQ
ncbi:molybdate ABC transporter substrate-binding protein [Halorhodospira abdelmalekii]|uniref:molybdate ABC transporter substrate-binding protein n=1 Tax=Halorhodospira abdelmalekii TaxID=421629 RepID=UPI001905E07F|nr:molybdate ABC transporter substrate-binding protein [Halorhodospira abdelmalekii]MBK1735022.1 molybdate ABC transporter substrate-binding protein [Halorhodospira abdelmalekii]